MQLGLVPELKDNPEEVIAAIVPVAQLHARRDSDIEIIEPSLTVVDISSDVAPLDPPNIVN